MGFVGVPELRQLQELIGARHDELPMVGFLQNIHRIIHCLAQQQKQLRGNALRNGHQLLVHLLNGDPCEMPVQKLHQCGHLVPVHLQLHPQQLGFHPVVAHHHDHDAAFLIHWQQIKAAGGDAALSGSRHIGGVIHKAADGPTRLRNHPVQLLHFHLEGLVDLFGLR